MERTGEESTDVGTETGIPLNQRKKSLYPSRDPNFLKMMTPFPVIVGAGVLTSALLPRSVSLALAGLLLVPPAVKLVARQLGFLPTPARANLLKGRYTARLEGDFCVFMIGARNNGPSMFTKNFSKMGMAMDSMIKELESMPEEESGFLSAQSFYGTKMEEGVQLMVMIYWRSFDHMVRWATDKTKAHHPGFLLLSKLGKENPDYGFWHEAFTCSGGKYETIYVNCPPLNFGRVGELVPATGRLVSSNSRMSSNTK